MKLQNLSPKYETKKNPLNLKLERENCYEKDVG